MSKISFKDLFSPGAEEKIKQFKPARLQETKPSLLQGLKFPGEGVYDHFENHASAVVCIVSMTCLACIDMLPELSAFADSYKGKFVVISSGSEEENQELVRHFAYRFPVRSMSVEAYTERYGVDATPYVFHLMKGIVSHSYSIQSIRDLYELAEHGKGI
ncbi:hypothetical protein I6N90_01145 [Paenibacillus sp. GSMTC-2017]|uniref:TlpA family protein disulfide reductase n=1 Tax=Paenibacillus sp. GSMTC-2017 TaxID=2794350 RepID=UPI0018D5F91D|nr:hypothetical protein [Paenibacillus sp. GSMTC-2017]MBH5316410.1 hypothetical protein [Paenibacillus sp. GSMTC-2017]